MISLLDKWCREVRSVAARVWDRGAAWKFQQWRLWLVVNTKTSWQTEHLVVWSLSMLVGLLHQAVSHAIHHSILPQAVLSTSLPPSSQAGLTILAHNALNIVRALCRRQKQNVAHDRWQT